MKLKNSISENSNLKYQKLNVSSPIGASHITGSPENKEKRFDFLSVGGANNRSRYLAAFFILYYLFLRCAKQNHSKSR